VAATSVGGDLTTYCLPITSCAAIADANAGALNAKPCALNPDCGLDDVNDGQCLDLGGGNLQCSYACGFTYQCPASGFATCNAMSGLCVP
jgi:hypothetical protein